MEIKHALLLLEDELESGEMLAYYLELNHFQVHWAKDGKQALAIIESYADEIELAILDIMVPFMDGKEICAHIRKHPVLSDIPVLFLTARDEEKDEIEGLELGADDYIKNFRAPPGNEMSHLPISLTLVPFFQVFPSSSAPSRETPRDRIASRGLPAR